MKQNNQEKIIIFFWEAGRLEEYQKGFWAYFSKKKSKKR